MKRWFHASGLLLLPYAALLGYVSWYTFFGYVAPDYRPQFRWEAPWITAPTSGLKHAYFRKKITLQSQPTHAWVAVMAPDEFDLIVNGAPAAPISREQRKDYTSGYMYRVFDIAPYLGSGSNVLGVYNRVSTFPQEPRIVVQGEFRESTGQMSRIESDATWRVAARDESLGTRGGILTALLWSDPKFDDGQWRYVVERGRPRERLTEPLAFPPALVTHPLPSEWLWTADGTATEAYFRVVLHLPARPRDVWLRVAAKRHYRLLVNGYPVSFREQEVGAEDAAPTPLDLYNITPFLSAGRNVVGVRASSARGDRGLLIDAFVDGEGRQAVWVAPERWKASSIPARGWVSPRFDDSSWTPAKALNRVTPLERRSLRPESTALAFPLDFGLRYVAAVAFVLVGAVAGCVALWVFVARLLAAVTGAEASHVARWLPLTFVPSALLLATVYLLGFDARLATSFTYQPRFIIASVALVLALQLIVIVAAATSRARPGRTSASAAPRAGRRWRTVAVMLAVGLMLGAFALRVKDVRREALGGDEATAIRWAQGVLVRGYPSMIIDGRLRGALTSELLYYFKAITVGLAGADVFGLRLHDVSFGALTVLLLYGVGARVHSRRAGLLAAAVFAILPSAIGMTHYGRYPSQQAFFALLTFGLMFRALEGGTFRAGYYHLATAGMIATYLTWEGAAYYLPSLVIGALVLTRPSFDWVRKAPVWVGIAIVGTLVAFQLGLRFVAQAGWQVYGTGAQDVAPGLAFLTPFYDPWFYVKNFLLLENHQLLTLAFVLGSPLWFGRSRACRALGFSGMTLFIGLFMMTNFLELVHWRYVYHLFPLLVLNGAMVAITFVDCLTTLVRRAEMLGRALWAIRRLTVAATVGGLLVFSTSFVFKLYNHPLAYASTHTRIGRLYFPSTGEAVAYVQEHWRSGDIVVATYPHVVEFFHLPAHYYLQFDLSRPLILTHEAPMTIHRITSAPTVLSPGEFTELLARSARVWFIVGGASTPTSAAVPEVARTRMRLVYEDLNAAVLVSEPGEPARDPAILQADMTGELARER